MKKNILLLLAGISMISLVYASGNPVMKETADGNTVKVNTIEEGRLSLFSGTSEFLPATIPQDPAQSFTKSYKTYFVSKNDGELVEVHCSNYKKVLRAHTQDNPDLAGKIGQKGYKLNDIEKIVQLYNQD